MKVLVISILFLIGCDQSIRGNRVGNEALTLLVVNAVNVSSTNNITNYNNPGKDPVSSGGSSFPQNRPLYDGTYFDLKINYTQISYNRHVDFCDFGYSPIGLNELKYFFDLLNYSGVRTRLEKMLIDNYRVHMYYPKYYIYLSDTNNLRDLSLVWLYDINTGRVSRSIDRDLYYDKAMLICFRY